MAHSPSHTGPLQGAFGGWHNITVQAAQQFMSVVNVTKHVPSVDDLIWAGPRMMRKLGFIVLFPDGITEFESNDITSAPGSDRLQHPGMMAADMGGDASSPPSMPIATHEPPGSSSRLPSDGTKGLSSVFSYATSKWALCCAAMAIILNRAYIFAATRRRLVLPWQVKLAIRGVPLLLLGIHARQLLQSLQCQTSPEFPSLRWDDPNKSSDLMFSHPNRFLHSLSFVLLLGPSDHDSCLAVKMIPHTFALDNASQDIRGSLGLLWPLFGTFCLSQLVETIVCAVEGRPLTAETGMTLFEHSLAFAEADAAISNQLGLGGFAFAGSGAPVTGMQSTMPISHSMIISRVNTPTEVLLIAFLSTMAHITSHILGVFSLQARYRLASTAVWGLCFMASLFWSAVTFSLDATGGQSLLRFPTVCIIGFIPHVLVFSGIMVCFSIYGLALGLSALVPPPGHESTALTVRQRVAQAQANLQASVSFAELRISREMDFYTALLRAGFGAISLASEAVYLNEDSNVAVPSNTWLEERRLQQLEELQEQWPFQSGRSSMAGTTPVPRQGPIHTRRRTGFARERPVRTSQRRRPGVDRTRENGVGAAVRSARWLVAMDYMLNIGRVVFKLWAVAVVRGLAKIGLESRPLWLLRLLRELKDAAGKETHASSTTDGRVPAEDTSPAIPGFRVRTDDQLDVEAELRAHLQANGSQFDAVDEEELDSQLYDWWLNGHTWGQVDRSSDYAGSEGTNDADDTSVVSLEDTPDHDTEEWAVEKAGRPSRTAPHPHRDDSLVLDTPIQVSDLSRLLRPQNPEEEEETDTLFAHLASNEMLTRSRYRRVRRLQLTRVLATGTAGHSLPSSVRHPTKLLTEQDEARLLEQFLISRREARPTLPSSYQALDARTRGTSGMGLEGPQCVVCQSAPRAIIVWPCRCLSLCDDCRVALAMNNFDRCVCCRREVSSFGRIYVP